MYSTGLKVSNDMKKYNCPVNYSVDSDSCDSFVLLLCGLEKLGGSSCP